jgi:hypothetical protein
MEVFDEVFFDTFDEAHALENVVIRLAGRYPEVTISTVEVLVESAHHSLSGKPIRTYVPMLVEHRAKNLLKQFSSSSTSAP